MLNEFFDSTVFNFDDVSWSSVSPFLILFGGIAIQTLLASFRCSDRVVRLTSGICFLGTSAAFAATLMDPTVSFLGSALEINPLLRITGVGVCVLAFLSSLYVESPVFRKQSEWGVLLVVATLGLCLLPGARNWIALFVYLETFSISAYLLCCVDSNREKSLEAALKYLMMGAFVSSFYLLGVAFLFGLTGSFDFEGNLSVFSQISSHENSLAVMASFFVVAAFCFKVSVFPFHMWAADVYQGAPTPIAAFFAGATKLSVFMTMLMCFTSSGIFELLLIKKILLCLAISSIVFGSFMAVAQRKLRRMLAYSGVVNAGYMMLLLPYAEASEILFFVLIYSLNISLAFVLVELISRRLGESRSEDLEIASLLEAKGRVPAFALGLLAFSLLSLAGIPPLPGFFAKYILLANVLSHSAYWGVAVALFGTLLGLAYYLRCLVPLFFHDKILLETAGGRDESLPFYLSLASFLAVAVSIALLLSAGPLYTLFRAAEVLAR